MVRKLLAVVFAATLMAGTAWAAEDLTWGNGGNANWTGGTPWEKADGTDVVWSDGNAAVLDATSDTVTVDNTVSATTVTVQGESGATIDLDAKLTATEGLKVTDGSTLTLTGATASELNTVTVDGASTLAISDAAQIDSADLVLSNGTLESTGGLTIANDINLAAGENAITDTGAGELSGVISGAGKLNLSGANFTLSGAAANTYTGGTGLDGIVATFSNEGHFGTGDITFTGTGTGLTADTTSGMNVANNMILSGDDDTTIDHSGVAELELSGTIGGEKGLILKGGSGKNITLSGTNTYEGGTTIQGGGSVSIASNANLGAETGGITVGTTGATLTLLDNITDMNRAITMGANALTIAGGEYNFTNAGSVTGTGALTVTGDGTAETTVSLGDLSGHDTGGITVGNSDKVALEATNIASEAISLNSADNKFILNNTDDVAYDGAAIGGGQGTFIKKGAGELALGSSGNLTAGVIEVQSGTLIVNGGTLGVASTGSVAVFDGAAFNVAADTALTAATMEMQSGSTLVLGAEFDVVGNALDFASDSTLRADYGLTSTDSGDLLVATNIATVTVDGDDAALAGFLAQQNTTGLTRNVEYTINGTTGITATITDVADASAAVGGVLAKQGVGDMTEYAKPLAEAWGDIFTTYSANPNDPIFTSATGQSTAGLVAKLADGGFKPTGDVRGAEAATNFLTGMDMAKSIEASGQTARHAVGNIFKRIQQNNTLRAAMNDKFASGDAYASATGILASDYANRFWLAGMGMWENGDRYKGNAGYDYDAYGIQIGYDRVFGAVTVGGSFAYSNGDYEDRAALANDSTIEHYAFNLYGTYNHCSGFFASVIGGYTYSDYDLSAHNGAYWNRADYGADTWSIGTTLGYDFRPAENFTITPTVGLHHYNSRSDSFNSTGLNGIRVKSHDTELPLALSMKYDVPVDSCGAVVSFEVNGGYTYNFSDEGGRATARGYNGIAGGNGGSTTLKSSRHSYNIGGGVAYNAARWDAGLKYDYYTSKASDAHVLRAEVGFKF